MTGTVRRCFPLSRPPVSPLSGGAWLYAVPLNNGDPACWRPAWGGVRLRGNDWWSRLILGGRCRFAQDDTWVGWNVVRNLFGSKYSTVKLNDLNGLNDTALYFSN